MTAREQEGPSHPPRHSTSLRVATKIDELSLQVQEQREKLLRLGSCSCFSLLLPRMNNLGGSVEEARLLLEEVHGLEQEARHVSESCMKTVKACQGPGSGRQPVRWANLLL